MVEQKVTWSEAKKYCEARGARLAQPDNQEKNEIIKAKLLNLQDQCWFGLRKVAKNQWQWQADNSALGFSDWGSGREIIVFNSCHCIVRINLMIHYSFIL